MFPCAFMGLCCPNWVELPSWGLPTFSLVIGALLVSNPPAY